MEKPKPPGNLLTSILQGLESRDPIVINAWLETLINIIPSLSEETIYKQVNTIFIFIFYNTLRKSFRFCQLHYQSLL